MLDDHGKHGVACFLWQIQYLAVKILMVVEPSKVSGSFTLCNFYSYVFSCEFYVGIFSVDNYLELSPVMKRLAKIVTFSR